MLTSDNPLGLYRLDLLGTPRNPLRALRYTGMLQDEQIMAAPLSGYGLRAFPQARGGGPILLPVAFSLIPARPPLGPERAMVRMISTSNQANLEVAEG